MRKLAEPSAGAGKSDCKSFRLGDAVADPASKSDIACPPVSCFPKVMQEQLCLLVNQKSQLRFDFARFFRVDRRNVHADDYI
jgi:hypothetical protein